MSLSIFLTMVSMWIIARILSITSVVFAKNRSEMEELTIGQRSNLFDAPLDWVGWVGVATLLLLAIVGLLAFLRRDWTRTDFALGLINAYFAILLIVISFLFWDFSYEMTPEIEQIIESSKGEMNGSKPDELPVQLGSPER